MSISKIIEDFNEKKENKKLRSQNQTKEFDVLIRENITKIKPIMEQIQKWMFKYKEKLINKNIYCDLKVIPHNLIQINEEIIGDITIYNINKQNNQFSIKPNHNYTEIEINQNKSKKYSLKVIDITETKINSIFEEFLKNTLN